VFATTEGLKAIVDMPWEKSGILYVLIILLILYVGGIFYFDNMEKLA